MAQLEALRLRAFHAADAEAVRLAELSIAWPAMPPCSERTARACTRRRTGCRRGTPCWSCGRRTTRPRTCTRVDLAASMPRAAQDLLVHRPRFEVQMRHLPTAASPSSERWRAGRSLAQAFVAAAQADPLTEPAALCSLLLQEGLVTEFIDLPESSP
jgi:hypothetical protein